MGQYGRTTCCLARWRGKRSVIKSKVEKLADVLEEMKPLMLAHWQEVATDQDKVPLEPQYNLYQDHEANGRLLIVTLREKDAIVAYFVGVIAPGMHYLTCMTLTMDIFYICPEFRDVDSLGGFERELLMSELFDQVKKEAIRRGVKRAYFGSKVYKDASRFFESFGMTEIERWYSAYWG